MNVRFVPVLSRRVLLSLIVLAPLAPDSVRGQDDLVLPEDFSRTNSVTLLLRDARRRNERPNAGLAHTSLERDGRTDVQAMEGVACRCLSVIEGGWPKGYIYFAINPSFKEQDVSKVRVEVEYFDGFEGQTGVFGLQYDTTDPAQGTGYSSTQILPNVSLKGSGQWLKTSFHIRDATFRNAQNSRSDFRLWASPPELCVNRVTVTLEPQAPAAVPLRFDASGEAKLRDWNVQWDAGTRPAFSRSPVGAAGLRWLQISAPNGDTAASWRTAPLLEPGEYQFTGKARTEEAQAPDGGVTLRASGRSGAKVASEAPEWTTLTYDFAMSALGSLELVCEFRGNHGHARFDLDSLKLIRKSKTPR